MTEADKADARALAELLANDEAARRCYAMIVGQEALTLDSWTSRCGCGCDGVKRHAAAPEEAAQAEAGLDAVGAAWVARSAAEVARIAEVMKWSDAEERERITRGDYGDEAIECLHEAERERERPAAYWAERQRRGEEPPQVPQPPSPQSRHVIATPRATTATEGGRGQPR
jgi:hypothetical protein